MVLTKKSLAWISVVVALLCVYLTASLHVRAEEKRAISLLSIVSHFSVGKMNESAAMREVQPFLSGLGSTENDQTGVAYRSFVFDNTALNKLRLSNYRRFTVRLKFRDGMLYEKNAEFSVEHDCKVSVAERVHPVLPESKNEASGYKNHFSTIPAGFNKPVASATIIDDDTYAESQREADWRFNLAYLTRLGGCEDARVLLPAIAK